MDRIGIALSGGGVRALIFHLGVLRYLAEAGLFDKIVSISSVSGGSLCMGAIFGAGGNRWPTGAEFLKDIEPRVRGMILGNNIQSAALWRLPVSPIYWRNRVKLLAKVLEDMWGIKGNLQDLPQKPFWEINCTTFESGRDFRFRRDFMGEYSIGYVQKPALPISHILAASAAFPILIGPYILKTAGLRWTEDSAGNGKTIDVPDHFTLWDGGVYDNLGLEPLYKIGKGMDSEIDFLIVSNASAPLDFQQRDGNLSLSNLHRLLEIALWQVDSLRSREVYSNVILQGKGFYMKIGFCVDHMTRLLGMNHIDIDQVPELHISKTDAQFAQSYPTTLNSPHERDFKRILRHGYENARSVHMLNQILKKKSS